MALDAATGWVANRPTGGWRWPAWRELWAYRELALIFAARDLKVRYKQAAFGVGWALVQPLAGMAVFTLVFDRVAEVSTGAVPYAAFSYVSLATWTYLSAALFSAGQSMTTNVELVTKIYCPRILVPLAATLPGLVDLLIAVAVGVPLVLALGAPMGWQVLTLPLWLPVVALAPQGISLVLAALEARWRDIRHGLGLIVQLGLFASPVAYPTTVIQPPWRDVYALNPAVAPLEGIRWALAGAPLPLRSVAISLVSAIALAAAGAAFFSGRERTFADYI